MTNRTRVRDDRFEIDSVDQWLFEGDILDARVIEPVDVVPDCEALADVLWADRPIPSLVPTARRRDLRVIG
jgi:hypothetical protein